MGGIVLINIVILYTASSRLFTILFCPIFVPFLVKAIIYNIRFALGKIDFRKSGAITKEEYMEICGDAPDESDFRRII